MTRVVLSGELDLATVPLLNEQLAQSQSNGVAAIMLDLRDLTFIDASSLHAFLQARTNAKSNGHKLLLIGASGPARRLFEVTGTEFLIDEQEAVSLLERFTRTEDHAARRPQRKSDGHV